MLLRTKQNDCNIWQQYHTIFDMSIYIVNAVIATGLVTLAYPGEGGSETGVPRRGRQWRIQKFWKGGGGRKTIYQFPPHLSQMRTTKYVPFTRKQRFLTKMWANGGGPPPLNPPLEGGDWGRGYGVQIYHFIFKFFLSNKCVWYHCNHHSNAINAYLFLTKSQFLLHENER